VIKTEVTILANAYSQYGIVYIVGQCIVQTDFDFIVTAGGAIMIVKVIIFGFGKIFNTAR
jgi:hypothetical protein